MWEVCWGISITLLFESKYKYLVLVNAWIANASVKSVVWQNFLRLKFEARSFRLDNFYSKVLRCFTLPTSTAAACWYRHHVHRWRCIVKGWEWKKGSEITELWKVIVKCKLHETMYLTVLHSLFHFYRRII